MADNNEYFDSSHSGEEIDAGIDLALNNIASPWALNKIYYKGDLVIYNNVLYRCVVDESQQSEAWDSDEWDTRINASKITINDSMSELRGSIGSNYSTHTSYHDGDIVIYDNRIFQCKAISGSSGHWDSAQWEEVKLVDCFKKRGYRCVFTISGGVYTSESGGCTFYYYDGTSEYKTFKDLNNGGMVSTNVFYNVVGLCFDENNTVFNSHVLYEGIVYGGAESSFPKIFRGMPTPNSIPTSNSDFVLLTDITILLMG